jgi:hypothetical protein
VDGIDPWEFLSWLLYGVDVCLAHFRAWVLDGRLGFAVTGLPPRRTLGL